MNRAQTGHHTRHKLRPLRQEQCPRCFCITFACRSVGPAVSGTACLVEHRNAIKKPRPYLPEQPVILWQWPVVPFMPLQPLKPHQPGGNDLRGRVWQRSLVQY